MTSKLDLTTPQMLAAAEQLADNQRLLRDLPVLAALKADLDRLEIPTVKACTELLTPVLEDRSWLETLFFGWLEQAENSACFLSPIRGGNRDGGVDSVKTGMLFEHRHAFIVAQTFDPFLLERVRAEPEDELALPFNGKTTLLKVVGAGAVMVDTFETDPFDDATDFMRPKTVSRGPRRVLRSDSPILSVDGARTSFRIIGATGDAALLISTMGAECAPVRINISMASGLVSSIHPNSVLESAIQVNISTLKDLGHASAGDMIRRFLDYPVFYVRWHALRELASLYGVEALPDIAAYRERERNPMVQRAAAKLEEFLLARRAA